MSTYVFGYGSLINMKYTDEISNSLTRRICPVMIKGLKREFNVSTESNTHKVLGIKKNVNHFCNGILFKVNEEELNKLKMREKQYYIIFLNINHIIFKYNQTKQFKKGDRIICFIPLKEYIYNKKDALNKPISNRYFDICKEGCINISKEFYQDFIETTT